MKCVLCTDTWNLPSLRFCSLVFYWLVAHVHSSYKWFTEWRWNPIFFSMSSVLIVKNKRYYKCQDRAHDGLTLKTPNYTHMVLFEFCWRQLHWFFFFRKLVFYWNVEPFYLSLFDPTMCSSCQGLKTYDWYLCL